MHKDHRSTSSSTIDLSLQQGSIIGVTILALALGGSTEMWAQALILTLASVIILIAPPRQSLGTVPLVVAVGLLTLALAAFLPATWFSAPPWRHHLTEDLHVVLPATRTPQPWLTLPSCCLLFTSLVWTYYLLGQKWDSTQRLQAACAVSLGVAFLAILTVAAYALGFHVPGWNQVENRGWFPNRNQTADVLALGAIVNYALVVDRLRKGSRSGFLWMVLLAPLTAALVVSYSRAGILMFFGGICLWHLWPSKKQASTKRASLSLALILTLLTFFFLFGGNTLKRFQPHAVSAGIPTPLSEAPFRFSIQTDAFHFSLQSPWLGIGLGNFEALFAAARHASVDQNRALHPESDWLWIVCEMGWPAAVFLLAGISWWLYRSLPFETKRGESFRRATVVAVLMFLLHGLVDVSGHRIGSMWFALFLASLALRPEESPPSPRALPYLFRGLAGIVLLVACWWFASLWSNSAISPQGQPTWLPPTSADLARLKVRVARLTADKNLEAIEQTSTAALRIAPLDWTLYFTRAYAEVFQPGELNQAAADFLVARTLEPNWAKLCLDEGHIWLAANQPDHCIDAWQNALWRDPANRSHHYMDMLREAQSNPLVRRKLEDLGNDDVTYLLIFLNEASNDETKAAISRLLASDPNLGTFKADQREVIFANWWLKGDRADLTSRLLNNEDWRNTGWVWLAKSYAQQNDFQQAWQIVANYSQAPPIPGYLSNQPIDDLERTFYSHPNNLATGLMLALAEIKQGKSDDALSALRAVEKLPNHPPYVLYLEAQIWAGKHQWQLAWEAWQAFDRR